MDGPSLAPVTNQGTVDIIVVRIRDRIIDGTFAPGTQLGEANLAAQLQVSRGPVREALQRLIQEGLLRNIRNRGVFVRELNEDDIDDIALARAAVEKAAAAALARSQDAVVLSRLQEVITDMRKAHDWAALVEMDMTFHSVLVASLQARRLLDFYKTLMAETRMSLALLEQSYPRRGEIVEEHQLLYDAIVAGKVARLYRVIDAHLDHSGRRRAFALRRESMGGETEQPS